MSFSVIAAIKSAIGLATATGGPGVAVGASAGLALAPLLPLLLPVAAGALVVAAIGAALDEDVKEENAT